MKDFWKLFIREKSGQSLMEIIVGLAIGAILIGTASFGIAFILRSTTTNQNLSGGSQLTQGLIDNVQTFANSNWQNVYGLSKTSANQYLLVASGTSYFAVAGQEGVASNDIINGLVAKWGFDENAASTSTTTYDMSGNNYNGTLTGGPTRASSTCKMSNCLSFDGVDDYVSISNVQPFVTNFSVTTWVKPANLTNLEGIIFGSRNSGDTSYLSQSFCSIVQSNGKISVRRCGWDNPINESVVTLTTNNWYHIVVTMDSSVTRLYVNGMLDSSATPAGSYATVTGKHRLGVLHSANNGLAGIFDDVLIYNRALSASEVSNLYNSAVFTRYFYVENVCRTNDSSASISTTTSPCPSGTVDDPLTQKVTAFTNWLTGANTDQVSLARYITRWGNFAVRQTDWGGGAGQEGPLTAPNNLFSTGTNITGTSTLGSFQIQNLTQQ